MSCNRGLCFPVALCLFFFGPSAHAYTLTSGGLVEDFSSLDGADLANSTGVWNIIDGRAQSGVVVNGTSTLTVPFGDGTDGDLSVSSGTYTFDTDSKTGGVFNFRSVSIGAGATINVTGSNPLIIRSLGAVNIAATLDVSGTTGTTGATNGALAAPAGAAARAGLCVGGAGGAVTAGPVANAGSDGLQSDGTTEANAGAVASDGTSSIGSALGQNFYTVGFICGVGGGGGGSRVTGADYATGAGGGSGGGAVRIVALGNLTVGTVNANGGDGGTGSDSDTGGGTACSGFGGGGSGGAIWLQTYKTLTVGGANVNFGAGSTGVNGACVGGGFNDAQPGDTRQDHSTAAAANNTADAASGNQTYVVQSAAYNLGAFNAHFTGATVTSSTPSDSSVSVEYAGSANGTTFGGYTSDITQLSDQGYRYVKFRITLRTATAAGTTPSVSRVAIAFSDLGPGKIEADIAMGCSFLGIKNIAGPRKPPRLPPPAGLAAIILPCLAGWALLRRRGAKRMLSRITRAWH